MPPLPSVPNVLRVDFGWHIAADVSGLTRLFVNYTGTAPNTAACQTIADDLGTDFAAEFLVYCSNDKELINVEVTDLSSPTAGQGSFAFAVNGSRGAEPLGASTAMLCSMKIARRYRGGKPRTYLPVGIYTDLQTAQTWTSTFLGLMQSSLNAFVADIAATTVSGTALVGLVNVSYYEGFVAAQNPLTGRWRNIPKPRATPVVDPVLAWQAEAKIASQRRRNTRSP